MSAYHSKVYLSDLKNGMFVSQLPIPWGETPFPLQGFFIRSQDDIEELSRFCDHVLIDTVRSRNTPLVKNSTTGSRNTTRSQAEIVICNNKSKPDVTANAKPIPIQSARYSKVLPSAFNKEIKKTKRICDKICKSIENFEDRLTKDSNKAFIELKKTSTTLVESAINNPNAAIWLTQLESERSDLFQHSVNAAVWSIVFGRHLGLDQEVLSDITLALLLAKLGLLKDKNDNNLEKDTSPVNFIDKTLSKIKNISNVNTRVVKTIKTHLERHDGSGGPNGLAGNSIPLVGKIAGIADYYEALINPLNNQRALCSHEASHLLYNLRDNKFPGELVEAFIRAIGIYPTGSVVELESKELAIVVDSKPDMRLNPVLLLVTDSERKQLNKPKIFDLSERKNHKKIVRSLPSTSVSIKVKHFELSSWKRFSA